jgi:N4-gp56 family major capsid protein
MPITGTDLPEMFPQYYERKLLAYVKENLVANRYGQKFSLPRNSGRTAVFTAFEPLPVNTTPITFQPTPSTGASLATRQVSVTVEEYANYIDLDDFTDITSFVPLMDRAVDLLAYNAQQTLDRIAMNELTSGMNVIYAGGAGSRNALDGTKKLTKTEIRKAVIQLERQNIPKFPDGSYVCILHPDKLLDLFTDSELITLSMTRRDPIEQGYIGEFFGVKFVSTTAIPILKISTILDGDLQDVYLTLVLGDNAYGVVDIDGNTLQTVYTNMDKLGRVKTVGWRAFYAVKRLYEPAIVRIESN